MNFTPYTLDINTYEVYLLNYNNEYRSIKDMVAQFSVYFDLFTNKVKCEIIIQDSINLIESSPILGDEQIALSFKTPDLEVGGKVFYKDNINLLMQVYKITDRVQTANRSSIYTLHCINQETINNSRYAVNKSYKDMTAEAIVGDIIKTALESSDEEYILPAKPPGFKSDPSEGLYTFVFTGEKPFSAIKKIAKKAKNFSKNSKSSNYIFYHGNNDWYFKTLDGLINVDERTPREENPQSKIQDLYFMQTDSDLQDAKSIFGVGIRPDQKILTLHFIKQMDNAENLDRGLFNHTTQILDPLLKRFKNDDFLYERDRVDMAHIENINNRAARAHIYAENSIYSSERNSTKYKEYLKKHLIISHLGNEYYTNERIKKAKANDLQLRNPDKYHEFFKYDYASRVKINNIVLELALSGNTDLEVGQLININIISNNLNASESQAKRTYNRLFGSEAAGGLWLISNINHVFVQKEEHFVTHISCIKDVYTNTKTEDYSGTTT